MKILIVDDIKENIYLLEAMLKGTGHDIVPAVNGSEALEKLRTEGFDMIVSDILMPVMDGFKLCQECKGDEKLKDIPFVFYTATYKDERDEKLALKLGADKFLIKPMEPEEFIQIIQGVFRDLDKGKVGQKKPVVEEETETFKLYSERLVNKLEQKMLDLETEITERKRAEEEQQRLFKELKESQAQLVQSEKMSALGILVAGVSHELNNPMMGILNFSEYCLKHTTEDDRRYQFLQDIKHETERCIDIVSNLLTFSYMEKDGEETYQDESLAVVIERVVKLLSYRIRQEKVSLTVHIAENTPAIRLRVNAVQQVLLNLISNALDALVESQEKEIRIEVHPNGDSVCLAIADSGRGMTPEMMTKIYDPFFTTKPIGKGTGLGLAISRNVIDSHGGGITCESKPGVGTTFNIVLPIKNGKEGIE